MLAALPGVSLAGGLDFETTGARAIGRAGAVFVSADGGAALQVNPGGLARRADTRVQVGLALHDHDATYRAPEGSDAPRIADRGRIAPTPALAAVTGRGRWVIAAAYAPAANLERRLPAPAFGQPAAEVSALFPHRYAGLSLDYRRDVVSIGAAVRVTDWLGAGVALSISRVALSETRHVWAGFDGRDTVGAPARDLVVGVGGVDWFVPGAVAGVLIAPEAPLELGASVSYTQRAAVSGDASLAATTSNATPRPVLAAPGASARVAQPLIVRAGARYLGDRVFAEAGAQLELFIATNPDPMWSLTGVRVEDDTGRTDDFTALPSAIHRRDRASVRAAVDVELVRGFLWLTGGYAFATSGTAAAELTATYADLAAHTLAIGAESQWSDMTLVIGYARTFAADASVAGSAIDLTNPFDAGTATVGDGRYDRGHDAFGAMLEIVWP